MTTRRRFLSILAGAAALPALRANAARAPYRWQGIALGAEAQVILDHEDAATLVGRAVRDIRRLEQIFSLYRPESALSALNRDGMLKNPPFELVELLSLCSRIHRRTQGGFDPTVQPLWALYARRVSAGRHPSRAEIETARGLVGWTNVHVAADRVAFGMPGMQLTLNGIAQGYIADRLATMFRTAGVQNVLINTGEISALGRAPDGPWQVQPGKRAQGTVPLTNQSIATSSPMGTSFDSAQTLGHILDPRSGRPGGQWSEVTVIAESAATADGLSTAFSLMSRPEIRQAQGNARVILS